MTMEISVNYRENENMRFTEYLKLYKNGNKHILNHNSYQNLIVLQLKPHQISFLWIFRNVRGMIYVPLVGKSNSRSSHTM